MGYRSDVRITTSKNGFEKLTEFVASYLKEKQRDNEHFNLLENLDIKVEGKEQCYFGWNYIKWYEYDYEDVDAIREGLEYLGENEYSYRFSRIGESYDDIEERYYDGEKDEDIDIEFPSIVRDFDDEYLKDIIQDKNISQEENKESIEI